MSSTQMLTPIRVSKRVNKFKGSLYESDQVDNLKDQDYNPNEFYDSLQYTSSSEVKYFTRRTSPRSSEKKQYQYEDDSDREYEFEEDEEYFPEQYVPRQTNSCIVMDTREKHRMVTRSSLRKI